jgi:ribosomal protein S18 acetylase RimI-like enzyme
MNDYLIHQATLKDIDFIIETIIAAEKSGTDKLSLATLFGLQESEVKTYLAQILNEEVVGCEFSISSFLVAEFKGECVAAVSGWLEGCNEYKLPSSILKANLLGYIFPKKCFPFANGKASIIKDFHIERELKTYQIEYVYVRKEHRGHHLAEKLIQEHIKRNKKSSHIQVQVFSNNIPAIRSYKNIGFKERQIYTSNNKETINLLPYNQKILMQKNI